jgi:hypothetical protein
MSAAHILEIINSLLPPLHLAHLFTAYRCFQGTVNPRAGQPTVFFESDSLRSRYDIHTFSISKVQYSLKLHEVK